MNFQRKLLAVNTWRDDAFLSRFEEGILPPGIALEYFCNPSNPFYDKTCVNQQIRMQKTDPRLLDTIPGKKYIYEGTHGRRSEIHTIQKIYQKNLPGPPPSRIITPLDLYYIIRGNVYLAPTFFQVIQSRVFNCAYDLRESLVCQLKRRKWDPERRCFVVMEPMDEEVRNRNRTRNRGRNRRIPIPTTIDGGEKIDEEVEIQDGSQATTGIGTGGFDDELWVDEESVLQFRERPDPLGLWEGELGPVDESDGTSDSVPMDIDDDDDVDIFFESRRPLQRRSPYGRFVDDHVGSHVRSAMDKFLAMRDRERGRDRSVNIPRIGASPPQGQGRVKGIARPPRA